MAKTKVSDWSNISDNNLDVGGINISDNMPPSFVNDGMREIMAQIKQWQSGQYAEPMTITGDLDVKGGMKLNSSAGTSGQFLMSKGDGVTPQWGSATIPDAFSPGMIILWSGSFGSVPSGWRLCNGTFGTPNLADRFIMGASGSYPPGSQGGTANATLVSHSHTISSSSGGAGTHSHSVSGSTGGAGAHSHTYTNTVGTQSGVSGSGGIFEPKVWGVNSQTTSAVGNHTHSVSGATSGIGNHSHSISSTCSSNGSSATNKNLPPYYALAYIIRVGG